MQVQAAIAEARAGGRGREALENGHASSSSTPRAGGAAAGSSSGTAPALAEGTETALLYVRFRAAAEPGLKGMLCLTQVLCNCTGALQYATQPSRLHTRRWDLTACKGSCFEVRSTAERSTCCCSESTCRVKMEYAHAALCLSHWSSLVVQVQGCWQGWRPERSAGSTCSCWRTASGGIARCGCCWWRTWWARAWRSTPASPCPPSPAPAAPTSCRRAQPLPPFTSSTWVVSLAVLSHACILLSDLPTPAPFRPPHAGMPPSIHPCTWRVLAAFRCCLCPEFKPFGTVEQCLHGPSSFPRSLGPFQTQAGRLQHSCLDFSDRKLGANLLQSRRLLASRLVHSSDCPPSAL